MFWGRYGPLIRMVQKVVTRRLFREGINFSSGFGHDEKLMGFDFSEKITNDQMVDARVRPSVIGFSEIPVISVLSCNDSIYVPIFKPSPRAASNLSSERGSVIRVAAASRFLHWHREPSPETTKYMRLGFTGETEESKSRQGWSTIVHRITA